MSRSLPFLQIVIVLLGAVYCVPVSAQVLQERLLGEGIESLAKAAQAQGDPKRGATVFYQSAYGCLRCHNHETETAETTAADSKMLGPDLTGIDRKITVQEIIESILTPSKTIKKGFETITAQL